MDKFSQTWEGRLGGGRRGGKSFLSIFPLPIFLFITGWNIYIYKSWLTIVEDDTKAPFSIATTPKCRGGHNFFLDIYVCMSERCSHGNSLSPKFRQKPSTNVWMLDMHEKVHIDQIVKCRNPQPFIFNL